MSEIIRVMLVDDHLIVRDGLRLIIETASDIEFAGEAEDGAEAVRLAQELRPDVILMDLRMPNMDGIEAIKRIKAAQPETAIVILTTYNEDELMIQGLRAGAAAFLLKDTDRVSLKETIRAAAAGKVLLEPDVMNRLLTYPVESAGSSSGTLTEREIEVLQLAAEGLRSKEIAVELNISERTVKAHLTSVYNKLGVDSRAGAIANAIKQGII